MLSYSCLRNHAKVTLPSVEGPPNIVRDPPRSIHTRHKPKVGEGLDMLHEVDGSSDRINEAILEFPRGVNQFTAVNYTTNTGNMAGSIVSRIGLTGAGAKLPRRVMEYDGAFRPPLRTREQLEPLSRLPRRFTKMFTNPEVLCASQQIGDCWSNINSLKPYIAAGQEISVDVPARGPVELHARPCDPLADHYTTTTAPIPAHSNIASEYVHAASTVPETGMACFISDRCKVVSASTPAAAPVVGTQVEPKVTHAATDSRRSAAVPHATNLVVADAQFVPSTKQLGLASFIRPALAGETRMTNLADDKRMYVAHATHGRLAGKNAILAQPVTVQNVHVPMHKAMSETGAAPTHAHLSLKQYVRSIHTHSAVAPFDASAAPKVDMGDAAEFIYLRDKIVHRPTLVHDLHTPMQRDTEVPMSDMHGTPVRVMHAPTHANADTGHSAAYETVDFNSPDTTVTGLHSRPYTKPSASTNTVSWSNTDHVIHDLSSVHLKATTHLGGDGTVIDTRTGMFAPRKL